MTSSHVDLCRFTRLSRRALICYGLLLFLAAIVSVESLAQGISPTDVFIQVENARLHPQGVPKISRVIVSHHGQSIGVRATATADTADQARRAATREAYSRAVQEVIAPRQDLRALSRRLAANTAELKDIKATLCSEKKTSAGYTFEVKIDRDQSQLLSDTRSECLSNYRIVTALPEEVDGQQTSSSVVETAVAGQMVEDGYAVYDFNALQQIKQATRLTPVSLSSQDAPAILGTRNYSNTVILGKIQADFSQDNEGIVSYLAEANFRVIQVDTGQVLLADDISEKGFGRDRSQASRNALQALAKTISAVVPAKIRSALTSHTIDVQPVDQSEEALDHMKLLLSHLQGVMSVEEVTGQRGSEFQVSCNEKPAIIANAIDSSQDYHVIAIHLDQTQ